MPGTCGQSRAGDDERHNEPTLQVKMSKLAMASAIACAKFGDKCLIVAKLVKR